MPLQPSHVLKHPVLQLWLHEYRQPYAQALVLHPIGALSAARIMPGVPANATAAKIGNALFAAFLKNSLLD